MLLVVRIPTAGMSRMNLCRIGVAVVTMPDGMVKGPETDLPRKFTASMPVCWARLPGSNYKRASGSKQMHHAMNKGSAEISVVLAAE